MKTSDGYEQREICLACTKVDKKHITAEVVQQYLETTLKNFGLPVKSIFCAFHDGDAKVIICVRDADLRSSLCFIRSLQRTIAVSFKGANAALAVLKRTKKAVTGARQSNVQAAYLRDAQVSIGAPQRALIQDNQTRWGSTHDMAERATEQEGAFPAAYGLDDDRNRAFSKKVFDPEKRLPFRQLTTELQSAGITTSLVVPAYLQLVDGLQAYSEIVVEMPLAGTSYPATSVCKPVSELDASEQRIVAQARVDLMEEEEEEEEGKDGGEKEDDEDVEEQWADMEEEVAGAGEDSEIVERDELGLDALMGFDFMEPSDDFWDELGEVEEWWLDDE
ncbi:hypothetical protein VYU27_005843 [Nannochloropsis oceanica]